MKRFFTRRLAAEQFRTRKSFAVLRMSDTKTQPTEFTSRAQGGVLNMAEPTDVLFAAMGGVVNVRKYLHQTVSADLEAQLFLAFSLGPSLSNTQPWEVLVLQDAEKRTGLIQATLDPFLDPASHGGQAWLQSAPILAVVLLERRRALARLGDAGLRFAIQDTCAAIQNFRLIAAMNGLCTSCVREFDPIRLRDNLELPWYVEPVAILAAGYSDEVKEIPPRLAVDDFVHKEMWA